MNVCGNLQYPKHSPRRLRNWSRKWFGLSRDWQNYNRKAVKPKKMVTRDRFLLFVGDVTQEIALGAHRWCLRGVDVTI